MRQYIGFNLNSMEYTIPILKVREIINLPVLTRMPHAPHYVEGITNLRGSIIPVVNLKKLVNLGNDLIAGDKVVVVSSGRITFGIAVDGITGVINIEESTIEPPENFLHEHIEQVEGVARIDARLVVLLNTTKLIPGEDASLFEDTVSEVRELGDSGMVEITKNIQTMAGEVNVKELHNAKDFFEKKGIDKQDPRHVIFDDMINFLDAITNNDYKKADNIIQDIMKKGQSGLFNEVGKITRKLHDALRNFSEALDPKIKGMTEKDVPNAVDRLRVVISRTEEAANKTMSLVEKNLLSMDELALHIRNIKDNDETVNYLKGFKNTLEDDLTEILTTQSFQDLTGQSIKKVIELVESMEEELVRLVTTFGLKSETVEASEDVVHEKVSQTDVDDLLKELGF